MEDKVYGFRNQQGAAKHRLQDEAQYEINAFEIFKQMQKKDPDNFEALARSLLVSYEKWYKDANEDYILGLFFPEYKITARIPGIMPIPTYVMTEKWSTTVHVGPSNSAGNVWIQLDPWYFIAAGGYVATITEFSTIAPGFVMQQNFTGIPFSTYFKQCRPVSAGIIVTYIGNLEQCKGEISSSLSFQQNGVQQNGIMTGVEFQNQLYFNRNPAAKGAKVIYVPKDTQMLQFTNPAVQPQFDCEILQVLCEGLPQNQGTVIRVETYRTVEGIPANAYMQLLTCEMSTPTPGTTDQSLMTDVQRVVQSNNKLVSGEVPQYIKGKPSQGIFDTLKSYGSKYVDKAGDLLLDAARAKMDNYLGIVADPLSLIASFF